MSTRARTMALDPATVRELRAWRKEQAAERLLMGGGWADTGLVFTNPDGGGLWPQRVTARFRELSETLGLPMTGVHGLPHSAASFMIASGVNPKGRAEPPRSRARVGHARALYPRTSGPRPARGRGAGAAEPSPAPADYPHQPTAPLNTWGISVIDSGEVQRSAANRPPRPTSWQRPSNEHMNGLLRQYFPKGTDLNNVSRTQLAAVAIEMNGRPRKVLNWRTPAEAYHDLVATAA